MILGDGIAALSTLAILILYLTGQLAIWHLYLAASINGGFAQIQQLAYIALTMVGSLLLESEKLLELRSSPNKSVANVSSWSEDVCCN